MPRLTDNYQVEWKINWYIKHKLQAPLYGIIMERSMVAGTFYYQPWEYQNQGQVRIIM